ncbi:MAG: hypothetical protein HQ485_13830 [Acidobacteria bacterium]|nr:hypothetical protein [Acidobacteriota bacterium]
MTVRATIANLTNPNTPYTSGTVTIGSRVGTTGADGFATITGVLPGMHLLTATGGFVQREVMVNIMAGGTNEVRTNAFASSFNGQTWDQGFFDQVYRLADEHHVTHRWESFPQMVLDMDTLEMVHGMSHHGPGLPFTMGAVSGFMTQLPRYTGGLFPSVGPGSFAGMQRSGSDVPAAGTPGTWLVHGQDLGTQGEGHHSEWLDHRGYIIASQSVFNTHETHMPGVGSMNQELFQTLGACADYPGSGYSSVVCVGATTEASEFDVMNQTYLYNRPPRTKTPDNTSAFETITGTLVSTSAARDA